MELNTVHLGDSLELMSDIPDKSIDMILCDLPYGVTNNSKDIALPFEPLWQHYNRIIKDTGVIALFAQGLFYVDLVNSNREMFRYDLVWDKVLASGFLNAKRMPMRVHEQIAVFYKKLGTYNPIFTEGYPTHPRGVKFLDKPVTNQNYGKFTPIKGHITTQKYPKSILTFSKPHPTVAKHRTEKSVPCLEWLIKTYTNEGETVLDNCCGSGTTAAACMNTGRKWICMDNDPECYKMTLERIHPTKFFEF